MWVFVNIVLTEGGLETCDITFGGFVYTIWQGRYSDDGCNCGRNM